MKKMFLFAATAAIAMSSCSKNEVLDVATPNDNPYTIGFNTGMFTTKGTALIESGLQSTTVKVLIDPDSKADITPAFTFGTEWSQNTHKWSAVDFPADVYSLQDNTGAFGTLESDTKGTTKAVAYGVTDSDVTAHKDLIYFGSQLASQPTSNNISAVFKHALSRAYISAKYTDCKIYIASASLVNMDANGTIAIKNNNSIAWTNAGNVAGDYNYLTYTAGATVAETSQSSPLSDIATHDMYVVPQTTVGAADVNAINQATETFIRFIYRVETNAGVSAIGYKNLADVNNLTDPNATITSGDASNGIFVVGYVAVDAKALAAGSYYNLLVDLSSTAVRYAEDTFVGPDGIAIEIDSKAITEPEVDKPVNPDADEYIGLTVVEIEDWPSTTPENL